MFLYLYVQAWTANTLRLLQRSWPRERKDFYLGGPGPEGIEIGRILGDQYMHIEIFKDRKTVGKARD